MMENGMVHSIQWFDGARTRAVPTRRLGTECPCDQCRVAQSDRRRLLQDCYFDDVVANADRLTGLAVAKAVV
jgi:hypothetical protein